MRKHASVHIVFALFVDIFTTSDAEIFKSHCQITRKMCHNAVKSVSNIQIMLCMSAA